MTAYLIAEIEVTDETLIDEYLRIARPALAKYGGRYVVPNALPEPLEGEWPRTVVVAAFDSLDQARRYYASPEYAPAIGIAGRSMARRVALLQGVAG